MAGRIHLAGRVGIAATALRWRQSLSGGPGGQHAQKTSSRVELTLRLQDLDGLPVDALDRLRRLAGPARLLADDELQLTCDSHRGAAANRTEVLARLRELVAAALVRPRPRRPTRPSRASIERRLEAKRQTGARKSRRRDAGDAD